VRKISPLAGFDPRIFQPVASRYTDCATRPIVLDNVEKCSTAGQATDDNIIRRMRFACCIPKATNTHSQYVILIAFQQQKWIRERATILRYTYIVCLVNVTFIFHTVFHIHLPHLPSGMTYI